MAPPADWRGGRVSRVEAEAPAVLPVVGWCVPTAVGVGNGLLAGIGGRIGQNP